MARRDTGPTLAGHGDMVKYTNEIKHVMFGSNPA
jgi:hypothetical protein